MQRVRKNSLSPCYNQSNKENVAIDNMSSAIGISFKNLQQARKRKIIQQSSQHQPQLQVQANNKFLSKTKNEYSLNPSTPLSHHNPLLANKEMKTIKMADKTRRQTQKSIDDYRSSLKSKQKQMSSLHSQVNTLTQTISLLKDQLASLKAENKNLYQENTEYKRLMNEKTQTIKKLRKDKNIESSQQNLQSSMSTNKKLQKPEQCLKCKLKSSSKDQYEEVIEKLNELEEVQNQLLKQNETLKNKENMNKAMYKNLKILLETNKVIQAMDLLTLLAQ